MAKKSVITLQLLCGLFWLGQLHLILPDHVYVHPGENTTLVCTITDYSEILWYMLRSDQVKLLISAKQGNLKKNYLLSHNVNESHFDITESRSSISLVIIGVLETDLGFYYCGGRNRTNDIQFGKLITLNFNITDEHAYDNSTRNSSQPPDKGLALWVTASLCAASVLMNLVCLCVICYRLKEKTVSCRCFSSASDVSEEDKSIHYTSIQHGRRSRAVVKKATGTEPDSVIYATVSLQPQRR